MRLCVRLYVLPDLYVLLKSHVRSYWFPNLYVRLSVLPNLYVRLNVLTNLYVYYCFVFRRENTTLVVLDKL